MRIALLLGTPGGNWGGMEKHVSDLAESLARLGHEIHILAHPDYQKRFSNIHFHPCPMSLGRRNPWLLWKIKKSLKRIDPDVAHAHGNKAAALLGSMKTGAWQSVGTVHGSKSNLHPFAALNKVIAVSRSIYTQLNHPNRFLVYNGAAKTPEKTLSAPPHRPQGLNVIAAGRLEPVKGFDRLIQSWPTVLAARPDARLTIFGDGSEMKRLKQIAKAPENNSSITIAGYQSALKTYLESSDLLVISSLREGFPYVLVEALLAECPVVSTPVSGCLELLPERALSPDFSASAISETISKALTDLEGLRESEQKAFNFAKESLTLEGMTRATVVVYTA